MTASSFRGRLAGSDPVQVVAFNLGDALHGCDVLLVQEVVTRRAVHPLPDMPPRLLGMLRLRGELVPVLDVAPLLEVHRREDAGRSVLIVEGAAGAVGIATDGVAEVMDVYPDAVRAAPATAADRDGHLIGVARTDGGLITLIDLAEMIREHTTPAHRGVS